MQRHLEFTDWHSNAATKNIAPRVIRSVYFEQDEILRAIIELHCPNGFECDMTYGNGAFWKNIPRPAYCYDIDPQKPEASKADSQMIPHEFESLNSVVFDPPFVTYCKNGREHGGGNVAITARFGGYYTYSELEDHYRHTISEAYRVLKRGGVMVFKCQDIVHNHRLHCTHQKVINWAEQEGFRLKDLFVLIAKSRMPSPQKGKQRHARIWHSYFLVLQKPSKLYT